VLLRADRRLQALAVRWADDTGDFESDATRFRTRAEECAKPDHEFERRAELAVTFGPIVNGLPRSKESGGKTVRLDLLRVSRHHRGQRLDTRTVAHSQVAELVREREALPDDRIGTVDQEQRAISSPIEESGDVLAELLDADRHAGEVFNSVEDRDRGIQAE